MTFSTSTSFSERVTADQERSMAREIRLAEEEALKNIKDIPELKVTKLARGVPLGGELEYVDRGTIMHAFTGRQDLRGKE